MTSFGVLFLSDFKRRIKSSFTIGYSVIFPIVMILILGCLLSRKFSENFTGYEYYAWVMMPFCCMMAVVTAAYAGKDDCYAKTAFRLLIAPISEKQIFGAKLLSCTLAFSICNIVVLLISKLIWKIYFGGSLFKVIALLTAETFCICAIGLFIGLGMKNFVTVKNFLNLPICIFAILGGSFFPIGTLNPALQLVFNLSPLTWMNRSIFLSIYDNDSRTLYVTTIVLGIVGILFSIIGMKLFNKEEFLNGDLPSYKK